jgi:hypothetical protein
LLNQATGQSEIQKAKARANIGNYVQAGVSLVEALKALPGNTEALTLQAEYKKHEPEQLEKERQERLVRGKNLFDSVVARTPDADLFESYEIKTTMPAKAVETAIIGALVQGQPAFKILGRSNPQPETYQVEAGYELPGLLGEGTTSGQRRCLIVCGQRTDNETQILFKVLEYKAKTTIKFSLANLLNTATTDSVNYIPVHPGKIQMTDTLQAQLTNGVQMVTGRIQRAIGQ